MEHIGDHDTIAAIATPPGRGGIAIVRISGPEAIPAARSLIESSRHDLPDRMMVHCHIRDNGDRIDEALACAMRAPRSYTGEDVVEIQCHGGSASARAILGALTSRGVRPAKPGEFTRRAFENGRIDLVQAESVMEIVSAESREHLRVAERLMEGEFSHRLETLLSHITQALSHLEAAIDFTDQGIGPVETDAIISPLDAAIGAIDTMLASHAAVRRIRDGVRVVIAGPVNAGKSSLFNRLLGRKRAIVTDTPGTTRDWIEERIELDSIPVNLVDTAGLRTASDAIEREGVMEAERLMGDADIIIRLFEPGAPVHCHAGATAILPVMSKSDLCNTPAEGAIVAVSSLTGEGIDRLREELARRCRALIDTGTSDTLAVMERHRIGLANARDALVRARETAGAGSEEITAFELDTARREIETVLGRHIDLAVLDTIFSTFCIGK